ncbi:MAG: SusC/RagA family TonB-linked outer membrane protein [Prevotella sp.]|jgi:TonB-linked SusC/RagA family outer membrane protein|nr:SusC/RagA family TonB-linked outer membrane protein [Prevotella sp.]MCI1684886.1 SusC/RagA family TonB-linked outer membrane protein [Prevotella sp.]MCI1780283.1 SusC/RagA family TonB-linked outer membrane protein [Prevotella sp.]MCI1802108.1 SusC/RagA family TonB-linked outer membrane protein [Prevotella sp.]MCI1847785.1 SusC/RagA family TonB-linked outer membrane protein [Prevotella sp.]
MGKRLMMFLACLFLSVGMAMAQTQVTGTVVSSDDGQPVVGASILVMGTKTGTVTDVDGHFTLSVPIGSKLRISYLGMQQKIIKAAPQMKITLQNDNRTLKEVVVTALGIKRDARTLGYSATTVNADEITKNRTSDIVSSLSGTVAGVQVNSASGDPGSSQSIIIRGFSSLSGSNQPLFVIDGVPMTNSSVSSAGEINANNASERGNEELNGNMDFGNGASAINPDDVASITILKGAAATALYGSRAACGVVMITTKSGTAHKNGVGVEYNGGVQWSVVGRLPEMQNEFGMGWNAQKTEIENGSWGPAFDGSQLRYGEVYNNSQKIKTYKAIKNNIRDFFDTGLRYNNSLSLNNANDNGSYFVSLSQISNNGILPTNADSYDKYTYSFRGDYKIKNLTVSSDVNYSAQRNKFALTGQGLSMINSIYQTPRDISLKDLENLNDPFNSPGYYYTPYGVTNPYWVLKNYKTEYKAEKIFGKLQFDYDFLKYFRATYRFGLDATNSEQALGIPNMYSLFQGTPNWTQGVFNSSKGDDKETMVRHREINQDFMLRYNQNIMSQFNVNALVGLNYNERRYHSQTSEVTNLTIPDWFNLSNSADTPSVETYTYRRRLYGLYGQVDLAWKEMVYLSVTGRNDWSSTLPKGNRSFFYPGITGSWVFSNLFGNDLQRWFDFAKLRLAWGQTGNDADVYMVDPYFTKASSDASGWGTVTFPLNGVNSYSRGNILGSSTLQPEITTEFEVGYNVDFFKGRINLDMDYYNRNSNKQIFQLTSDPATGYTLQNMNLGKIRNQGIEALLSVKPVLTSNFGWTTAFSFTKNWSKVISLPASLGGQSSLEGVNGQAQLYAITGMALGQFKAEVPERDPEGHIVVNSSTGLPVAASEQAIVGTMNNKYTLGINTTLRYREFSLNFVFDIRQGGLMYSRTKSINYFTGNAKQTLYNDRHTFIVPNSVNKVTDAKGNVTYVENTTPISQADIDDYFNAGGEEMGSAWLIPKSFVKLRNVSLSWNLPKPWLERTFLTGVRLTLFGTNLLCWTPSGNSFIDPESTSFGNDLQGNYGEYSANPSSRNFGFNVQVKF